jgi:hypothetical protein
LRLQEGGRRDTSAMLSFSVKPRWDLTG